METLKNSIEVIENKSLDINGNLLCDVFGANIVYNNIQVFIPVYYSTYNAAKKRAIQVCRMIQKNEYTQGIPIF